MIVPTVVFDLDGTLVDTAPDLVATLNVVLGREGLPPVAYETARNMVGGGARLMLECGLETQGRRLAPSDLERLVDDFIAHYAAHIADSSLPFPGLATALDDLVAHGCRLAVCTNKLEWLSVRLLDLLGLSQHFVAICGPDTFGMKKPDPGLLQRTIAQAGGRIERAVMVGDSTTDVLTARAAGVPVVAVDYGYSETPAAELGADRVIGALSELPAAVFGLIRAEARGPVS